LGDNSPWEGILLILGSVLSFSIVLSYGWKKTRRSFNQVFKFNTLHLATWVSLIIMSLGLVILVSELDNLLNYFLPMPEFLRNIFRGMIEGQPLVIALVLVVLIPSLAEEMLCRGLILDGFSRNYSEKKAIVVSALLFGLVHLNPWQFLSGFTIGLVAGWTVIRTGSLYPGIILHFVNNLIAVLMHRYNNLLPIPGFNVIDPNVTVFQPLWFNILGLALFGLGLLVFRNILPKIAGALDIADLDSSQVQPVKSEHPDPTPLGGDPLAE